MGRKRVLDGRFCRGEEMECKPTENYFSEWKLFKRKTRLRSYKLRDILLSVHHAHYT